jgi:16S rRNA (cytosine967-C5)-methyltransferase
MNAREVAAQVLHRVGHDGAFAAAALEAELSQAADLDARDRALATELTYGSLRFLPWLDTRIAQFAPRGTKKLDPRVRAVLRVAAYQLFFTRIPAFAAVSQAVEGVRSLRGERMAAFANAVLRKLATLASKTGEVDRGSALLECTAPELQTALERALGIESARAFVASAVDAPPLGLRIERATERDLWLGRLREAAGDSHFELGPWSPLAILARGVGRPQDLPGWRDGAWSIQEEGAQLAALSLGARPGEAVLDACAGRGNKTAVLARAVGPTGAVDASDSIPSKLLRLRDEMARLALAPRATFAVDWTVGSGGVPDGYDHVLVDAPCSGTGTLRRRPEMSQRRHEGDLARFSGSQIAIATRAARHVRPGGSLVYVVCSVLREEAEDVVDEVLRAVPELSAAPFEAPEARAVAADASSFRLLPHVHGTDGYFVARFVRRA